MTEEVGTRIPGEPEEGVALNPEIQEQKVKDTARTKGWKPLKEWDGDPSDWVPAKEFLGRERLFKKIHDLQYTLGQTTKRNQEELTQIRKHFEQVRETEYKRAVADLKAQRREAVAAGDVKAAEQIDTELDQVREQRAQVQAEAKAAPQQTQGPSPAFTEWHSRNKWFNEDSDMTQLAIEIGTTHAAANGHKSQAEVLEYVEKRIKKAYPEKFESTVRRGSPVEGGGSMKVGEGSTKGSKSKLTVSDLDDTEKHVLGTLLKTKTLDAIAKKNNRTPTEQYLTDLAEAKGLR